ncbi:type 1 glutamine amidotransferase domain-containing protein [Furfurilactobacillus milii]|uniref:DJ-1/PfpI/YhbO family deglycase/protease n=1 Tax=Furfurilactobacillus milii TaxID=2888272 RepID=A0A6N9I0T5_9LACO|nr:type 1 glutamine amidotransferase domain-containing protein [Furfurilactobacillus milii]MYV16036.1 DJ-1/PfpI/YhbO family deglycase/protease [Furfurilactobacillus milii]
MEKKIAVLVTNMVQDDELAVPTDAMRQAGYSVTLINGSTDDISGVMGRSFSIDAAIDDVKPEDFDALFLPGGFSPDQLRTDERFVSFVRYFLINNRSLFTICHGPQFFIQSGLINGRKLTSYESIRPDLYLAGAITLDQPVVEDGNLISSRTPDDLPQFVPAILQALAK